MKIHSSQYSELFFGDEDGFDEDDFMEDLCDEMADDIMEECDIAILQELTAQSIIEAQQQEEALRAEYPTLMEAWEEYQVKLKLIQAGQLMKQQ